MSRKHLLLLTLLTKIVHAEDCSYLKEGEVIRLDRKGGSLETFKTQDQDGLSTCYANAASLVLQAILPDHPEVSYLDIALHNKKDLIETELRSLKPGDKVSVYTDNRKNVPGPRINFGYACVSLQKVHLRQMESKKGELCLRNAVNLENNFFEKDEHWDQNANLLNASLYMNEFQSAFPRNSESDQKNYLLFKESLRKIIEEEKDNLKDKCQNIIPIGRSPFFKLLVSFIDNSDVCKSEQNKTVNCRAIRKLVNGFNIDDNGITDFNEFNPELISSFQNKIMLERTPIDGKKLNEVFKETLVSMLQLEPSETTLFVEKYNKVSLESWNYEAVKVNEIISKGFSQKCIEQNILYALSVERFKTKWQNNEILCQNPALLTNLSNFVNNARLSNLDNYKNIIDFIFKDASLSYDSSIRALYASDCEDDKKIKLSETFSCERLALDYANPKEKPVIDEKVFNELRNERPVVTSLCQNIYNGRVTTEELDKNCAAHAVPITGMKCENGKYKFLLQNSWGKEYIPNNKNLEADLNGSAWFDEKTMGDVVYSYEVFKP